MRRSRILRAERFGVPRRSTFNCWRRAITSASSEILDRKRSRSVHLSSFKKSNTRRSSPDSDPYAKRMEFAVGTRRVLRVYGGYYNEIRTHRTLQKDTPIHREIQSTGILKSRPILGGLHNQYVRI